MRGLIPPYYWIDQLCIDQSNIDERNQQVSMMASVYSSAYSGLVIWLGVGSVASDWAMDIIQQPPPRPEHVLDIAPFRAVRSVDDLKANEIYPLYALAVIAQSGYWRRLWIIQEIVLGTRPRVRFGNKEITLKQLDTFLDACNRVVYAVQRRRDHLENITRPVELRPRTDRSVKLGTKPLRVQRSGRCSPSKKSTIAKSHQNLQMR
jgi:hypothetical protein